MQLRISRKFLWKVRFYRVTEFALAMLMFLIFYIIQIPLLLGLFSYSLWRARKAKSRNPILSENMGKRHLRNSKKAGKL